MFTVLRSRRSPRRVALLLARALLWLGGLSVSAGCGGGGGGGGQAQQIGPQTVHLTGVPQMDGVIWPLRVSVDPTERLIVGRAGVDFSDAAWAFCTFDVSGIPAGAQITSARLELFQRGGYGAAGAALPVLVDHMRASGQSPDFTELVGAAFELESPMQDAQGNTLILTHTAARNVRKLDVTRQVVRDRNEGRGLTRFRLRSETNPGAYGYVDFSDTENPFSELPPLLVITYQ